jgi:hypothetical protein
MARIGVVRSDVGGLDMHDLEPVAQWAPSIEPRGQERKIHRPNPLVATNTVKSVAAALALDSHSLTAAQIAATAPLIVARALPLGGAVNVAKTNLDFNYSGLVGAAFDFATHPMDAGTAVYIQDECAPSFVETGVFLLSFDHGTISKFKSASYAAYGSVGAAIKVVDVDGSTPFVLP